MAGRRPATLGWRLPVDQVPAAINDNGVIVGDSAIYSNGTFQDLNTLIPAGSGIEYANAIDDNGQIAADGLLLTPN